MSEDFIDRKIKEAKQRLKDKGKELNPSLEEKSSPSSVTPKIKKKSKRKASAFKNSSDPPHLKKLDKAKRCLPKLNTEIAERLNKLTQNLNVNDALAVEEHIKFHIRSIQLQKAVEQKDNINLQPGQKVQIVSGNPQHLNKMGTVDEVRNIRVYVKVPNARGRVYLYTTDVKAI